MRAAGTARLVLVEQGSAPPLTSDVLEDWIRIPASEADIESRIRVLADRLRSNDHDARPELDENGLLHFAGRWVSLPPLEVRLVGAMLDRYRALVSRDALLRAGWPDNAPGRNVLDVHIVRLRRRVAAVGLVIRTVRSRGYLLDVAEAAEAPARAA